MKKRFFSNESSQLNNEEALLEQFKLNYLETNDFVRATVYWVVGSEATDDVVQTVYLKAWKSYKSFNKDSSFKTWIYRIAKNAAYDYLKSHKKLPSDAEEERVDSNANLESKELKEILDKGVLNLSLKHREVFMLFYKLGYTKKEISELLKTSEGTVKSRLHYAKESFVAFLKKHGVENGR